MWFDMATHKKISFDIDAKTLKKLDDLAVTADRTRAYILNELLHDFLDDLSGFYLAAQRLKRASEQEYTPIGKAWELVQQKRDNHGKGGKR